MTTPFDAYQQVIFAACGYASHSSNDIFVWDTGTPTAGIIAAVAGLPAASVDPVVPYAPLLNLEHSNDGGLTQDPLITAMVVALTAVDAAKATAFLNWHYAQWLAALDACEKAATCGCLLGWAAIIGLNLGDLETAKVAACNTHGLTRLPTTRNAI